MYLFALSPPIHVSHNQPLLVLCATYREGISWESASFGFACVEESTGKRTRTIEFTYYKCSQVDLFLGPINTITFTTEYRFEKKKTIKEEENR